jgi:hypothetical protein
VGSSMRVKEGDRVTSGYFTGVGVVVFVRKDGRLIRVSTLEGREEWLMPRDITQVYSV